MIEKERNETTSFVFKREPRTFLRRSIKSFPTFRRTSQRRIIRMMMFRFTSPKKKIEFTKGRVLETRLILNSSTIRVRNRKSSEKIAIRSLFRFSRSFGSSGGISRTSVVIRHFQIFLERFFYYSVLHILLRTSGRERPSSERNGWQEKNKKSDFFSFRRLHWIKIKVTLRQDRHALVRCL